MARGHEWVVSTCAADGAHVARCVLWVSKRPPAALPAPLVLSSTPAKLESCAYW